MTTTSHTPIVGIFNHSAMAEHTLEELKDTAFSDDEIWYSGPSPHGSILDLLKMGVLQQIPQRPARIASELNSMGLPADVAHYYAQEFAKGHSLVAVQPFNDEQAAIAVLRHNGGHI